jgi:hypothetical protein
VYRSVYNHRVVSVYLYVNLEPFVSILYYHKAVSVYMYIILEPCLSICIYM